jgi:hypothetical protein
VDKPTDIELHGGPETVKLSQDLGSSSGTLSLTFLNGNYAYVVYQIENKYDMPMNASGVIVKHDGKQISWLGCTSDNYTAPMMWNLDSRRDLVDTAGSDLAPVSYDSLPNQATTPCGWLTRLASKKYCDY